MSEPTDQYQFTHDEFEAGMKRGAGSTPNLEDIPIVTLAPIFSLAKGIEEIGTKENDELWGTFLLFAGIRIGLAIAEIRKEAS